MDTSGATQRDRDDRQRCRRSGRSSSRRADGGDIVVGWLTKIIVVAGLVGLVGFDSVSIGVAHMSVVDDADTAVQAASAAWQNSHHNIELAYQAAQKALPDPVSEEVEVKGFTVSPDGTVQLTVRKTVRTLIVNHISKLAHYAVVTATESGKSIA